ncbi:MAG: hypothetical protein V1645_02765 [archaeon]
MPEFDYVLGPLKVSQEATFDMKELYKLGRAWYSKHGYDFYEKEYISSFKEEGKNASIKWEGDKKVDDYIKFHVDVRVKFKNLREIQGKKKIMNIGEASFSVESYIERDYESNWDVGFMTKFIRGVYDTFVIRGKIDKDKQRLASEANELYHEIRTFLKVHQPR